MNGREQGETHKVGKSLSDVRWFHEDFVSRESEYLNRQLYVEGLYNSEPRRKNCILCSALLGERMRYSRGAMQYIVCPNCSHVNGRHEITENFSSMAYGSPQSSEIEDDLRPYSSEFSTGKMKEGFSEVVSRIYRPKSEFLANVIGEAGEKPISAMSVIDFGCGSGHFVRALEQEGFGSVLGVDSLPSAIAEALANGLGSAVHQIDVNEAQRYLGSLNADIVTMMCVLPHLNSPFQALESMRQAGVRWTFQKLPMWSLATLLEASFPELRSRVLGMDHTHVFTWDSLDWLEKELGLRRVGSWSFGSDALDLQRKIHQILENNATLPFVEWAENSLAPALDSIQLSCDQNGLSSEIHLVWEFV